MYIQSLPMESTVTDFRVVFPFLVVKVTKILDPHGVVMDLSRN